MPKNRSILSVKGLKHFAGTLLATRSLRNAYLLNTGRQQTVSVCVDGIEGDLRIRTGTSDARLLRQAVVENFSLNEYGVPPDVSPRTILDIGANNGVVAIKWALAFPDARVFAFEPFPPTVALLRYNLRQFPNVTVVPYALGQRRCEQVYYCSDDSTTFGGGGFHPIEQQLAFPYGTLPVVPPAEAIAEYHIHNIDIIKIDTEGAEHEILTSFPAEVLADVAVIVGELHGVKDQDVLQHLSTWFDLQHDPVTSRLSFFRGVNRSR